jgi:uncharacterized pyridoxamine 5'-phosphate oxidase family protein
MDEVYEFLKKANTYYLATVDGDQPRVRPFGTVDIFEGRLYIQTGLSKPVAQQLQANPKAEICAFDGGQWLRIAARLVHDDRIEPQEHLLADYPALQEMYKAGDGNNAVFYLEDAEAIFASFVSEPRTVTF